MENCHCVKMSACFFEDGLVEGLILQMFITQDGDLAVKFPVEIAIPDPREEELAELVLSRCFIARASTRPVSSVHKLAECRLLWAIQMPVQPRELQQGFHLCL